MSDRRLILMCLVLLVLGGCAVSTEETIIEIGRAHV